MTFVEVSKTRSPSESLVLGLDRFGPDRFGTQAAWPGPSEVRLYASVPRVPEGRVWPDERVRMWIQDMSKSDVMVWALAGNKLKERVKLDLPAPSGPQSPTAC